VSAHRDEIVEFCNDVLELNDHPDYGPMGMQFEGVEWVDKIATAVSISKDVIERTHAAGAQLLIVHHGMFWNNESRILDARVGGRLELLEKYGITVLAYHLALDAHPVLGNNRKAAEALGLRKLKPFDIGWGGEFKMPMMGLDFIKQVQHKFDTARVGSFWHANPLPGPGPRGHEGAANVLHSVERCAVIVGGAYHYIVEAHRQGYDTFFTGEASEPAMHLAEDLGMNFVWAGHHNTEQMGVQALAKQLTRKFRVETEYLPIDNPV
jgi:dinuclear metal center YbgI/SA1388 family protein